MKRNSAISHTHRMKLLLSLVCGLVALRSAESGAQPRNRVLCRWGPKSKMAPVPRCGVPRSVEVTVPRGTYRLYFSREDNPGLNGYFFRGKNAQGPGREFKNKVNLVSVVLMLCPADFQKQRLLAFQKVDRKNRLRGRPTCRLGPPSEQHAGGKPGADGPKKENGSQAGAAGQAAKDPENGDDEDEEDVEDEKSPAAVNRAMRAPKGTRGTASWKKIDRFARTLGMISLALGLVCLAAIVFFALFFKKKLAQLQQKDD